MGEEVPEGDGSGVGYIEGVLGAALWNLDAAVADIDSGLTDAFHLVAKNYGILATG